MRSLKLTLIALCACSGCGSELPDDRMNPLRAQDAPRLVPAQEALDTSEIATIDPHTMNDAEISKALGEGPFCAFRYVSDGNPVLAWKRQSNGSNAAAVVKINGVLVGLQPGSIKGANAFVADAIRLTLLPSDTNRSKAGDVERPTETKLLFEIDRQLRVGYDGYAVCPSSQR